jgi:ATP-dependent RNA helicase DHX37/DHR1
MSVGDPFLREEALGAEDSSGGEEETADLSNEKVRAKEASKLRRRAYFQSQQVRRIDKISRYKAQLFAQYHSSLGKSMSDLFRFLSVVGAYEYAGGGQSFCAEHFVRPKVCPG